MHRCDAGLLIWRCVQNALRKAYYEPFERLSGIKTGDGA
jgi:hypothetical protein